MTVTPEQVQRAREIGITPRDIEALAKFDQGLYEKAYLAVYHRSCSPLSSAIPGIYSALCQLESDGHMQRIMIGELLFACQVTPMSDSNLRCATTLGPGHLVSLLTTCQRKPRSNVLLVDALPDICSLLSRTDHFGPLSSAASCPDLRTGNERGVAAPGFFAQSISTALGALRRWRLRCFGDERRYLLRESGHREDYAEFLSFDRATWVEQRGLLKPRVIPHPTGGRGYLCVSLQALERHRKDPKYLANDKTASAIGHHWATGVSIDIAIKRYFDFLPEAWLQEYRIRRKFVMQELKADRKISWV